MDRYLIIKAFYDDFERIIAEEMAKYPNVEVLPVESFDDAKSSPSIRFKQITSRIKELKKQNYFNKFNKVIVFENPYVPIVLNKMIKQKVYLYNWGVPDKTRSKILSIINKILVPVYVFDKGMANKYNMPFNDQFYFKNLAANHKTDKTEYDMYFIGNDKGRYETVRQIRDLCRRNNISYNLQVVRQWDKPKENEDEIIVHNYKNYDQILDEISKTNIVLDIVKSNQEGATLRVVEALFFNKKIITNNKSVKKWNIYSSNNILVIDDINRCEKEIVSFINGELSLYNISDLEYYSFENWIKRFD